MKATSNFRIGGRLSELFLGVLCCTLYNDMHTAHIVTGGCWSMLLMFSLFLTISILFVSRLVCLLPVLFPSCHEFGCLSEVIYYASGFSSGAAVAGRGVASNLFCGGINFYCTLLQSDILVAWRHRLQLAHNSFQGLILGGYIYRYTPSLRPWWPGRTRHGSRPRSQLTRMIKFRGVWGAGVGVNSQHCAPSRT